jgi:glycosyltransferase involved in cell wall biosynthesis
MPANSSSPNATSTGNSMLPEFTPGLVSIITPTFNRSALLRETLASIRAQTWRPIELIIVDDGSTDDTLEQLQEWPTNLPKPGCTLHVLRQKNLGPAAARNRGVRHSTGEFIYFLDSDDLIHPEAIARFVAALHEKNAAYVYAFIEMADEQGRPLSGVTCPRAQPKPAQTLFKDEWLIHGAIYRRHVITAAGPFNETLRNAEDFEFIWRVKALGEVGYFLPVVQGVYRQHAQPRLSNRIGAKDSLEHEMDGLDIFVAWARQTGRLDESIRGMIIDQYFRYAIRLGGAGPSAPRDRGLATARSLIVRKFDFRRLLLLTCRLNSPKLLLLIRSIRGLALGVVGRHR